MISSKMVDWVLYNLPSLRTLIDDIEPSMSASVVLVPVQKIATMIALLRK